MPVCTYISDDEIKNLNLLDDEVKNLLSQVNTTITKDLYIEQRTITVRRWFKKHSINFFYIYWHVRNGEYQILNYNAYSKDVVIAYLLGVLNGASIIKFTKRNENEKE